MEVELGMTVGTAAAASAKVMQVAGMFGLGVDRGRMAVVVPRMRLSLRGGQVVFVTGPSGGGKSTLLGLIRRALTGGAAEEGGSGGGGGGGQVIARVHGVDGDEAMPRVLDFGEMQEERSCAVVDCFGEAELKQVLGWLSLAGLNDAFVMLRRPRELSDGQRYRLRLARMMGRVAAHGEGGRVHGDGRLGTVVLADEFGATLDRQTAKVVAKNVRKWVSGAGVCFVAATTHDDLLEALEPEILVEKGFGERMEVVER